MNTQKLLTNLAFILVILVSVITAVSAAPIPIRIDEVRVDDFLLSPNDVNRLDIIRGQIVPVDIKLVALTNIKNVEVAVFISGFEYADVEPLSDATRIFDADVNVSYIKRLSVRISDDVEEDDYKLRIIVSDRNSQELIQTYNLKLDVPRNSLRVEDIVLNPSDNIQAGKALLAKVRVQNKGEKQQNNVRITVSIPELGVSTTDYIDELRVEDEEETEEMFLKIPETAKSGRYQVKIDVEFQDRHNKLTATRGMNIIGKETPASTGSGSVRSVPKAVITVTSQLQTSNGESVLFPISVQNNYDLAKVAVVSLAQNSYFDITITPSSTAVIDSGDIKLFTVSVKPRDNAPAGPMVLQATVRVGDEISKQVPLTVNIVEQKASGLEILKYVLEGVLIVLVVVLVIIGLIIAFSRGKKVEQQGTSTYY